MRKSLNQTLDFLKGLPRYDVKPGLKRITFLLDRLGNPEKDFYCLHIGGSNGKGSVLALLSSVLGRKYRLGEFISPPLREFSERIRVGGVNIDRKALNEGINLLKKPIEDLEKQQDPPSFFEATTALAAWHFSKKEVDLALVEVGLGGRYDATNPVGQPLVSTVTSTDLEHQRILGDSLEEIAEELAGIAQPGSPLIVGPSRDLPDEVFRRECQEKNCKLLFAEDETRLQLVDFDWESSRYKVIDSPIEGLAEDFLELGLTGSFQEKNLATALTVLGAIQETNFSVSLQDIKRGLTEASWPARFELISKNPHVVIDVAHNVAACQVLAEELNRFGQLRPQNHTRFLLFSALDDKDVEGMLQALKPEADLLFLTEISHKRGLSIAELEKAAKNIGLNYSCFKSIQEAARKAKERANSDDLICISGSLYLVREAIQSEHGG